jgi:hypothetical protein
MLFKSGKARPANTNKLVQLIDGYPLQMRSAKPKKITDYSTKSVLFVTCLHHLLTPTHKQ